MDFVVCEGFDFFQGVKKKCMVLHDVIFGDDVDLKFDKKNEFSGDPLEDQAVQDHGQVPAKVKLERLEPMRVVDKELSSALGWECEEVREAQSQSYGQSTGRAAAGRVLSPVDSLPCRSSLRRTPFTGVLAERVRAAGARRTTTTSVSCFCGVYKKLEFIRALGPVFVVLLKKTRKTCSHSAGSSLTL